MPRKVEEVVLVNEEETEEETVVVEEVREAPMVKILPKRDFKCRIANEWYYFYKDKPVKVSPFIESILRKDPTKLYM